jgi:hypothetical protein
MREKIQRRASTAEARMDLATGGIEAQIADVERESLNIQVEDALGAYKRQMGVAQEAPASMPVAFDPESTSEKSLGPSDKVRE